ncbi:hypothetical protein M0804_014093 [Polistes exclamans]|nr:hypothetical protein M0804_014093 [Polistes exclamans]
MHRGLVKEKMRDSDSIALIPLLESLETGRLLQKMRDAMSTAVADKMRSGNLKSGFFGRMKRYYQEVLRAENKAIGEQNRKLREDFAQLQKEQRILELPIPHLSQQRLIGHGQQRVLRLKGRDCSSVFSGPETTNVPPRQSNGFVEVGRRGRKRADQTPAGQETPAGTNFVNGAAPSRAAKKSRKRRERRRRARETAAVSLTCKEDGGYLAALTKANDAINLKDIGIGALLSRRSLNGAFIWQVRGKEAGAKAEKVAEALRRAVPDAKISVPQRCSFIRLVGLQAAVTATSIRCALLEFKPGVDPNSVKIDTMRLSRGRLSEVTVTALTALCLAALDRKRININLTSVRVLLLGPRPLRCHRCLARGHVAVSCPAPFARIGVCFVCGEPSHVARMFTSMPRCPICVEAGRPQSSHKAGS